MFANVHNVGDRRRRLFTTDHSTLKREQFDDLPALLRSRKAARKRLKEETRHRRTKQRTDFHPIVVASGSRPKHKASVHSLAPPRPRQWCACLRCSKWRVAGIALLFVLICAELLFLCATLYQRYEMYSANYNASHSGRAQLLSEDSSATRGPLAAARMRPTQSAALDQRIANDESLRGAVANNKSADILADGSSANRLRFNGTLLVAAPLLGEGVSAMDALISALLTSNSIHLSAELDSSVFINEPLNQTEISTRTKMCESPLTLTMPFFGQLSLPMAVDSDNEANDDREDAVARGEWSESLSETTLSVESSVFQNMDSFFTDIRYREYFARMKPISFQLTNGTTHTMPLRIEGEQLDSGSTKLSNTGTVQLSACIELRSANGSRKPLANDFDNGSAFHWAFFQQMSPLFSGAFAMSGEALHSAMHSQSLAKGSTNAVLLVLRDAGSTLFQHCANAHRSHRATAGQRKRGSDSLASRIRSRKLVRDECLAYLADCIKSDTLHTVNWRTLASASEAVAEYSADSQPIARQLWFANAFAMLEFGSANLTQLRSTAEKSSTQKADSEAESGQVASDSLTTIDSGKYKQVTESIKSETGRAIDGRMGAQSEEEKNEEFSSERRTLRRLLQVASWQRNAQPMAAYRGIRGLMHPRIAAVSVCHYYWLLSALSTAVHSTAIGVIQAESFLLKADSGLTAVSAHIDCWLRSVAEDAAVDTDSRSQCVEQRMAAAKDAWRRSAELPQFKEQRRAKELLLSQMLDSENGPLLQHVSLFFEPCNAALQRLLTAQSHIVVGQFDFDLWK